MLCERCRRISFYPAWATPDRTDTLEAAVSCLDPETFNRTLFHILHPNLHSLYASNNEGCHCCVMIWHFGFKDAKIDASALTAKTPVILHITLAPDEEWFSVWIPRNGAQVSISWSGTDYGKWHFLQLEGTEH